MQEDDDEPALLMVAVCALNTATEIQPARVELDETRAQIHLGEEGGTGEKKMWYVDSGASNHMTGDGDTFSELDTSIVGTVKFGDGSRVEIQGRGTVLLECRNGAHRALSDVYYIPMLRSNILSIGQLDEHGCRVLIDDGVLRILDRERKLIAKVNRSANRLYKLDLHITRPVCLAAQSNDVAWL